MKKLILLFIAALLTLNPACSGGTLECNDTLEHQQEVNTGSFIYTFKEPLSVNNYLKIIIPKDGKNIKKEIKEEQTKSVMVNGEKMWQTIPILITQKTEISIYRVKCEYVY